jgi:hypothetical protein
LSSSFVFAQAWMVRTVPPDKRLVHCDKADPLVRSARLFTHGWRFCTPGVPIVYRHRDSPVGSETSERVVGEVRAVTAAQRVARGRGIIAALSIIGEDPCKTCSLPRARHTSNVALNHPFEPHDGVLVDRHKLIGSARSLKHFRKSCGSWVGVPPTKHAARGVVRRRGIPADELSVKAVYAEIARGGSANYA